MPPAITPTFQAGRRWGGGGKGPLPSRSSSLNLFIIGQNNVTSPQPARLQLGKLNV